ncbi:hypothetical protein ACFE04_002456 [Oxalis oulophora]
MALSEPMNTDKDQITTTTITRKPRILLAASGSVAAIKFRNLCHCFSEWAEVKAVATKASLHFIEKETLPEDVVLYTDDDEWSSWNKIGDNVLHIELRRWADILVIAPLSANTLGKERKVFGGVTNMCTLEIGNCNIRQWLMAGGLCDNLLTCIIRAWDYSKPLFIAPAMNTFMWTNPFTERHLMTIDELGITLIPPVTKKLACGDYGNGAMAEPSLIYNTVRLFVESRPATTNGDVFDGSRHCTALESREEDDTEYGGVIKDCRSLLMSRNDILGSEAVSLCNINDAGVNACKPAVTQHDPPVDPSADCCKALKGADLTCLCSYKNSPMLPMLGIEPGLAMALPKKCGFTPPPSC